MIAAGNPAVFIRTIGIMLIDFSKNHFELFGLPASFQLDITQLEQAYRQLQAQVHPDKHAHLGETEKRLALQWATQANHAYQTLRQPLARARYLLQLNGIDTQEETNTAMPADFLMEQMEWREAIGDAKAAQDITELEALLHRLRREVQQMQQVVAQLLDEQQAYAKAAELVRKLRFFEKLDSELGDAIEAAL